MKDIYNIKNEKAIKNYLGIEESNSIENIKNDLEKSIKLAKYKKCDYVFLADIETGFIPRENIKEIYATFGEIAVYKEKQF